MRPIDKLKEIIKEWKEYSKTINLTFEEWLEIAKYPNQLGYWLLLAKECGFMTGAEVRRATQQLIT